MIKLTHFSTHRVLVFANEALKCQSLVTDMKLVTNGKLVTDAVIHKNTHNFLKYIRI